MQCENNSTVEKTLLDKKKKIPTAEEKIHATKVERGREKSERAFSDMSLSGNLDGRIEDTDSADKHQINILARFFVCLFVYTFKAGKKSMHVICDSVACLLRQIYIKIKHFFFCLSLALSDRLRIKGRTRIKND